MVKIFVDMDGVLVDFNKGLEEFNIKNDESLQSKPKSEWTEIDRKLDRAVRDCMNTPGFFLGLPPMPGYWDLWRAAGSWPFVLTAWPKTTNDRERVREEKKTWCDHYLGPLPDNRFHYCSRQDKKNFATDFGRYGPEDQNILVDDLEENISHWEDAGGLGILYKNHTQAISDLRKALRLLNG